MAVCTHSSLLIFFLFLSQNGQAVNKLSPELVGRQRQNIHPSTDERIPYYSILRKLLVLTRPVFEVSSTPSRQAG